MNKYKKLIGNSAVFAIGSMGSKLIAFLMIPLYTFVLSRAEYGTIDIITTTANMLMPLISLSIGDAVFRFALDKSQQSDKVLTNGLVVSFIGAIVGIVIVPILSVLNIPNVWLIYYLVVFGALSSLLVNFSRAIGMIKTFASAGIIGSVVTAVLNIVLLAYLKMGISGYLWSLIIASLVTIVYIAILTRVWRMISFTLINFKLIGELLIYSIPLIPNAFSWWINTSSSRYFILYFVGASANGLFAVANKIPSLISMLSNIFFQSWQLSAVEEFDSKDSPEFYSTVFNSFIVIQLLGVGLLLVILKPLMGVIVSNNFYESWKYIPFLSLAVIYSSLSGFIGTTYIAAKRTKGILTTTVIGALLNIILGFIFVPLLGIQGASFGGMLAFLAVLIIRIFDTRKIKKIDVQYPPIIVHHGIIILMIFVLFYIKSVMISETVMLLLFVIMCMYERKLLKNMLSIFK